MTDHPTNLTPPLQDGYLELLILQDYLPSGTRNPVVLEPTVHRYSFNDHTWQVEPGGLAVTSADGRGKVIYGWTIVGKQTLVYNSAEYELLYLEYIRLCDHDWISHPRIGHYCEICRVDMADLELVLRPDTVKLPALVVKSDQLDEVSRSFDGVSGREASNGLFGDQPDDPTTTEF